MARVTGPLMSVDASGTYGGSLTFAKWKGRNYVRQCVTPSNPRSASQTGVRAMMSFLSKVWASLTSVPKATWDEMAASRSISAFNAFVSYNLSRWQMYGAPSQAYPAAETISSPAIVPFTATGGRSTVQLSGTPVAGTFGWGVLLFRSTSAIGTPSWSQLVAAVECAGESNFSYTDSPLEAGTYHYKAVPFSVDGKMGTATNDTTATVT